MPPSDNNEQIWMIFLFDDHIVNVMLMLDVNFLLNYQPCYYIHNIYLFNINIIIDL